MKHLAAWLLTCAVALTPALAIAHPAEAAAARVGISGPHGATIAATGSTTLTLSGSGFQSIEGGFGGIYVMFGAVDGTWRPTQGGSEGNGYRTVPDAQDSDNGGHLKFIAFPGDPTSSSANGGFIAANGTWHTTLNVPGAVFTAADGTRIDCRVSTCGVLTIGAHGQKNANNETFTGVGIYTPKSTPTPHKTTPARPQESVGASAGVTSGRTTSTAPTTPGASASTASPSSTPTSKRTAAASPSASSSATAAIVTDDQISPTSATTSSSSSLSATDWTLLGLSAAALIGALVGRLIYARRKKAA